MATDARLPVLSFTGSDSVGWHLESVARKKHVLLELGGNAPCLIDETVDLEALLPRVVDASFANAGQVCIKAQRVFVVRERFDEFLERFVALTRALPVGDPLDERTVVGPHDRGAPRDARAVVGGGSDARRCAAFDGRQRRRQRGRADRA